jgi:acetyl-CoA carboxylase carboxyl transferase subunit beta
MGVATRTEQRTWVKHLHHLKRSVPAGLWTRCDGCHAIVFCKDVERTLGVCPECDYHLYVPASKRIDQLLDAGSFCEWFADLESRDPLGFEDRKPYAQRLIDEQNKTGLREAAVVGRGCIKGRPLALGITDSAFMMGSMASVVGEKLCRTIERATVEGLPLVLVSGSGGGARMQEGILSLMQMAKVSAALARFDRAGRLFVSVLTNPTMGGVAASFASLGDVILAEPKAMIGFAGPRTIMATVRLELPRGFQSAEFLLEHGFIDRIVHRSALRDEIARIIDYCRVQAVASSKHAGDIVQKKPKRAAIIPARAAFAPHTRRHGNLAAVDF